MNCISHPPFPTPHLWLADTTLEFASHRKVKGISLVIIDIFLVEKRKLRVHRKNSCLHTELIESRFCYLESWSLFIQWLKTFVYFPNYRNIRISYRIECMILWDIKSYTLPNIFFDNLLHIWITIRTIHVIIECCSPKKLFKMTIYYLMY